MNRRWFVLLVVLFLPLVYAEISLDSLEEGKYNLGESVSLSGYFQNSEVFTGDLEIKSVCGNESKTAFFSLLTLDKDERYEFSQDYSVGEDFTGSCYFDVIATGDSGGNEQKKSEEYTITRELRVDADIDILSQKPGKEVIVSGVIRKINGIRVESGSVALTLDGKVYASGLSDGAFSYEMVLPLDINSGDQKVIIQATDLIGNEGVGEVDFRVISIPSDLIISFDKAEYKPKDRVLATVFLNDQSGKNVVGSSTVQLIDPNGDRELTKVVDNGNDFEVFLSELSLPGTWTLKAENKDFEANKKFYVEEVKSKEVKLLENTLIVRNTGNVNYDEPIQVNLIGDDGEEFSVIKKTSLKPNQTLVLDLNDEAPGGNYDVEVGGSLITGKVVLEGSSLSSLSGGAATGYVALIFVFLFLVIVVVSKGRKRLSRRSVARERGKEILLKKEDKEETKVRKEDVDHMLKKAKESMPLDSKDDKNSKDHPFDIFN
jgi:hypothetical protein